MERCEIEAVDVLEINLKLAEGGIGHRRKSGLVGTLIDNGQDAVWVDLVETWDTATCRSMTASDRDPRVGIKHIGVMSCDHFFFGRFSGHIRLR